MFRIPPIRIAILLFIACLLTGDEKVVHAADNGQQGAGGEGGSSVAKAGHATPQHYRVGERWEQGQWRSERAMEALRAALAAFRERHPGYQGYGWYNGNDNGNGNGNNGNNNGNGNDGNDNGYGNGNGNNGNGSDESPNEVHPPEYLNGPSLLEVGEPGAFTATGASSTDPQDVLEYLFDWGDGFDSAWGSGAQTHTWAYPGSYEIRVMARGFSSQVESSWSGVLFTVTVNAEVFPPNSLNGPSSLAVGVSGTYTAAGASSTDPRDELEYLFDWGDGSESAWGSDAQTHTWASPGSYEISVMAYGTTSEVESSSSDVLFTVTVNAEVFPPTSLNGPDSLAVGEVGTFTAAGAYSTDPLDELEYLFDWGDGSESAWGSDAQTHMWASPGSYEISVMAYGTTSEVESSSSAVLLTVTVIAEVFPPNSLNGPSSLTVGASGTYTAAGASSTDPRDELEYLFDWGDGSESAWGSNVQTHAWAAPGTYAIRVMARGTISQVESAWSGVMQTVTVNAEVFPPTSLNCPDSLAVGEVGTYTATGASSTMDEPLEYLFDWGDVFTSAWGSNVQTHAWAAPGVYGILVKARGTISQVESAWSGVMQTVTVNAEVFPPTSLNCPDSLAVGEVGTFTVAGASSTMDEPLEYLFDWGDVFTSAWGSNVQTHAWAAPGVYGILVKARGTISQVESAWSGVMQTVTVNAEVFPPTSINGPNTLAVQETGTFTAAGASSTNPQDELEYKFDWGDGSASAWGSDVQTHAWAAPGTYAIRVMARGTISQVVSSWSDVLLTVTVNAEVFPPNSLNCPDSLTVGEVGTYTAAGAYSTDPQDDLEYQFDWGDGSESAWGSDVQTHAWVSPGTYAIQVMARGTMSGVVSSWSAVLLSVTITDEPSGPVFPPIEDPTDVAETQGAFPPDSITIDGEGPAVLDPEQEGTFNVSGGWSTYDESVKYQFDWGDGSFSEWSWNEVGQSHAWISPGTYGIKGRTQGTYTYWESSWSDVLLTVTITGSEVQSFTLTTNVNPVGSDCWVYRNPDQTTYLAGTYVYLEPRYDPSAWQFNGWSGDIAPEDIYKIALPDSIGDMPTEGQNPESIMIVMSRDKTVTANFTPLQTNLTVTTEVQPAGAGIVTVYPERYPAQYSTGESITVSAVVNPGYLFDHWGGSATGTIPSFTMTVTENLTLIAYFIEDPNKTLVTESIPPEGGYVLRNPEQAMYPIGTAVQLEAVPFPGYVFTAWSGGYLGTDPVMTITIAGDTEIFANFNLQPVATTFPLTTVVQPAGAGMVYRNPPADSYAVGEIVALVAEPGPGYIFDHWEGAAVGVDPLVSVSMDRAISVTAVFIAESEIPALPDAVVGQPYAAMIPYVDPGAGGLLGFTLVEGPSWLSLDGTTGELSGTPTEADAGEFTIRVLIVPATGDEFESVFTLKVVTEGPGIAVLPDAIVGQPYVAMIPYVDPGAGGLLGFTLVEGPWWLSLDGTTGELSGTPTEADAGEFTVRVLIVPATGDEFESVFTLKVVTEGQIVAVLPDAVVGQPYSAMIPYVDPGAGGLLGFTLVEGPSWLSLDGTTGELSGTPTEADADEFTIRVQVTDSQGLATEVSFTLTVQPPPVVYEPPAIAIASLPDARVDESYAAAIEVTDTDPGDTLVFELTAGPAWLSIGRTTGALSGTPAAGHIGAVTVSVRVTDSHGLVANASFTLTMQPPPVVYEPPVITTASLPDALANESYDAAIEVTDTDPGDTHVFELTAGPAWLSIGRTTGTLSGTPAAGHIGAVTVSVRVTDSHGLDANAAFTLIVQPPPVVYEPPVIVTGALPDAIAGIAYQVVLAAQDPDANDEVTFSLESGPAWLRVDADGTVTGTPVRASAGEVSIVIRATDSHELFVTQTYRFIVLLPPEIVPAELPQAVVRQEYRAEIAVIDAGQSPVFSLGEHPQWLSLGADGVLSGAPDLMDAGESTVTLTVTAPNGLAATRTYTLAVIIVNEPPAFPDITLPDAWTGIPYEADASAVDSGGDTLVYRLLEAPRWLTLDAATGALSGTPALEDIGEGFRVLIEAADWAGFADTLSTAVTVRRSNHPPVFMTDRLPNAQENTPYVAEVTAADPDGDPVTYTVIAAPSWLALDAATGALTGTPGVADRGINILVAIVAADPGGLADTLRVRITVRADLTVQTLNLSPRQALLRTNETLRFVAEARNTSGEIIPNPPVHWEADPRIGTINDTGLFTAVTGGVGQITVSVALRDTTITESATVTVFLQSFEVEVGEDGIATVAGATYPMMYLNGLTLEFPAGVLPAGAVLTFSLPDIAVTDDASRGITFPNPILGAVTIEVAVDGNPIQGTFDEPVRVTIPYRGGAATGPGSTPGEIQLFYLTDTGELVRDGITGVSVQQGTVTALVPHFSTLAVAPYSAGPPLVGDFDRNMTVNFEDFTQLVVYWNRSDDSGDIAGPASGTGNAGTPWYTEDTPYPSDGVVDFEDLAVFALMYDWQRQGGFTMAAKTATEYGTLPVAAGLRIDTPSDAADGLVRVTVEALIEGSFLGTAIELMYDPMILRVERVEPSAEVNGRTLPVQYRDDHGILTLCALDLGGQTVGTAGMENAANGLFTVTFRAVAEGPFTITAGDFILRDRSNNPVETETATPAVNGYATPAAATPFALTGNRPNPFNSATTLSWTLDRSGRTGITVYNILGQVVRRLVAADFPAGTHSVVWDGRDDQGRTVTSGVYVVVLEHHGRTASQRIMFLK